MVDVHAYPFLQDDIIREPEGHIHTFGAQRQGKTLHTITIMREAEIRACAIDVEFTVR